MENTVNRNTIIRAYCWGLLAQFLVAAILIGACLALLAVKTHSQPLSNEGQIAVNTEQINRLRVEHTEKDLEFQALRHDTQMNSYRIERMEMGLLIFGAIVGGIQAFVTITGRKLKFSAEER